jgi:hypothetical protein
MLSSTAKEDLLDMGRITHSTTSGLLGRRRVKQRSTDERKDRLHGVTSIWFASTDFKCIEITGPGGVGGPTFLINAQLENGTALVKISGRVALPIICSESEMDVVMNDKGVIGEGKLVMFGGFFKSPNVKIKWHWDLGSGIWDGSLFDTTLSDWVITPVIFIMDKLRVKSSNFTVVVSQAGSFRFDLFCCYYRYYCCYLLSRRARAWILTCCVCCVSSRLIISVSGRESAAREPRRSRRTIRLTLMTHPSSLRLPLLIRNPDSDHRTSRCTPGGHLPRQSSWLGR